MIVPTKHVPRQILMSALLLFRAQVHNLKIYVARSILISFLKPAHGAT